MTIAVIFGGLAPTLTPASANAWQDAADGSDGTQGASAASELRLVSQTAVVESDGVFVMDVDLGRWHLAQGGEETTIERDANETGAIVPAEDIDVVVTVYGRLDDPAQLEDDPSTPINRVPILTLAEHVIDANGLVSIEVPVRQGEAFDDVERIRLRQAGVYPVTLELRLGNETLDLLRTNLVYLPRSSDEANNTETIAASLIVDLIDVDGPPIDAVVELLAKHPSLGVLVLLGEGRLGELERDPALGVRLQAALGARPALVVAQPELDPSSLAAIDQGDLYQRSLERRQAALGQRGIVADDTAAVLSHSQTRAGVRLLAASGIATVIDLGSLRDHADTSDSTFDVSAGQLDVVTVDELSTLLGGASGYQGSADPLIRAHLVLGGLAIAGGVGDTGDVGEGTGAVVVSARPESGADLETLAIALELLDDNVHLVSPGEAVSPGETVSPGEADISGNAERPSDRSEAAEPAIDFDELRPSIEEARARLGIYEGFYLDGPTPPEQYRDELVIALGGGVTSAKRTETINALNEQLGAELAVIALPQNQSVTLAARSVPIPLTIENNSTGTRQVLLRFRSDKIVVAEDGQLITVEPGTSSIDVQVEARSLGTSPLQVLVMSPDGSETLATSQFRVRSTAVPGLGLLISAVGLSFLGVWWYLSIRRTRSGHPSRSGSSDGDPTAEHLPHDRERALASDSV